jgi:asparagine synthase (glutamine-hydrolysing)
MCGIYGVLDLRHSGRQLPSVCDRMGAQLVHRGPDDEGRFGDGPLSFGMRRLSIIDVAGGHQPIANEDESVWIVCNGEIYNFRELRVELERAGHRFRTGSDTEVIAHLYEEHGDDCVTRLGGMFAFALWDRRRQRLLIGRDRLGIKPLYYFRDGERLCFASEIKALLVLPGIQARVFEPALQRYLALGYSTGEETLFAGICRLPPASTLSIEQGRAKVRRYWTLPLERDEQRSEAEWCELLRDELDRAVHAQMVSDVPLGAFLSGGIDSSAVVAMMARHSDHPVQTYSIGFDRSSGGALYNELPYAAEVAKQFGTRHREIIVTPDVAALLPRLLWHLDEPMADAAFITTYLVSRFAREDVTVILSGVGGDELFGGYNRYLDDYYQRAYRSLPRWIRSTVVEPVLRRLPSDRHAALPNLLRLARSVVIASDQPFEHRYQSYLQVFGPERQAGLLGRAQRDAVAPIVEAFAAARDGDQLQRLLQVDMATQLPDDLLVLTDKMSMATSLECRVPLLDERLVELAARMPARFKIRGRKLKYVLKKALEPVLPARILHRGKRGFGAPVGAWLKCELAPLLRSVLSRQSVERRGLLHWPVIAETIALHDSNREDHTDHLLALLNLELWCRLYLDGRSPEDVGGSLAEEAA